MFFFGGALGFSPLWAETTDPISITAKSMTAENENRRIIFEGNVILEKAEFTLKADRLEITLAPPEEGGQASSEDAETLLSGVSRGPDAISLIEAIGHVEVAQEGRHGKSERAIYDHADEKVILIGDPEVWSPDYRIRGTRMIFYLREQKNVVEDSQAILYSE